VKRDKRKGTFLASKSRPSPICQRSSPLDRRSCFVGGRKESRAASGGVKPHPLLSSPRIGGEKKRGGKGCDFAFFSPWHQSSPQKIRQSLSSRALSNGEEKKKKKKEGGIIDLAQHIQGASSLILPPAGGKQGGVEIIRPRRGRRPRCSMGIRAREEKKKKERLPTLFGLKGWTALSHADKEERKKKKERQWDEKMCR